MSSVRSRNTKENRPIAYSNMHSLLRMAPAHYWIWIHFQVFQQMWFCNGIVRWCSLWEKCKKNVFGWLRLWNSFTVNTIASGDQSFTAFDRRSGHEINFLPHLGELRNFSWHSLQFKSRFNSRLFGKVYLLAMKHVFELFVYIQCIYIYIYTIQSCEKVRTPYWIPWFSVS